MNPFVPSDEQRRNIVLHLNGEIDGLLISYKRKRLGIKNGDPEMVKISHECFLLHARNLIEFFLNAPGAKPYQDNVRLNDFIAEIHCQQTQDIINSGCPHNTRVRINKQLSHISYDRLSDDQQDIKLDPIHECLIEALELFNSLADEKYKLQIKMPA